MPRKYIAFGEWRPDLGIIGQEHLVAAKSCAPAFGGYLPLSAIEAVSQSFGTGAQIARGLHAHAKGPGDFRCFAGTNERLYHIDPGGTPWTVTDYTRAAGVYATASSSGWQFTSFGPHVLATNFASAVQYWDGATPAVLFIDAFTSTDKPFARYVTYIGQHLLIGNYVLGAAAVPHGVWWSALNDPRTMGTESTHPRLGTGNQPLNDDLGHVTGLVGGIEYALVARDKGWVRIDGPPFTVSPVVIGEGCRHPNSIVQVGRDVYFRGSGAFMVLEGGSQLRAISDGSVSRVLLQEGLDPSIAAHGSMQVDEWSGTYSPLINSIFWSHRAAGSSTLGGVVLIYNISEKRWSFLEGLSDGTAGAVPGITYLCSRPDAISKFSPGREVLFVTRNDTGADTFYVSRFTRDTTVAPVTLHTAYIALDPELKTRVNRVRPIVARDAVNLEDPETLNPPGVSSVFVRSRNQPYRQIIGGSAAFGSVYDEDGWLHCDGSAEATFHRFEFALSFDGANQMESRYVANISGFQVEYDVGGER